MDDKLQFDAATMKFTNVARATPSEPPYREGGSCRKVSTNYRNYTN